MWHRRRAGALNLIGWKPMPPKPGLVPGFLLVALVHGE
jgi:hypothetical protein